MKILGLDNSTAATGWAVLVHKGRIECGSFGLIGRIMAVSPRMVAELRFAESEAERKTQRARNMRAERRE